MWRALVAAAVAAVSAWGAWLWVRWRRSVLDTLEKILEELRRR